MRTSRFTAIVMVIVLAIAIGTARVEARTFKVGVSIYAGWMPYYYMMDAGIMDTWEQKYGIEVEIVPFGDYIASVEAFVAGQIDACTMTNMEALDMPAASGVDCTVMIVGDYSNGNDAVITRDGLQIENLKGHHVYLVELSVSHYLLVRGLEMKSLSEQDVTLVNTSDSDIGPVFLTNRDQKAMVTWNPIVMNVMQTPGLTNAFDSAQIPGEILDLLVVRTDVLNRHPAFGKAVTGAWYETMKIMTTRGPKGKEALSDMAKSAESSLVEYQNQLRTTMMFYRPKDAVAYTSGSEIQEKMDLVRRFCAGHGLLGEEVTDPDVVGIEFPGGVVLGDKKNIKLRFITKYMQLAADGKL